MHTLASVAFIMLFNFSHNSHAFLSPLQDMGIAAADIKKLKEGGTLSTSGILHTPRIRSSLRPLSHAILPLSLNPCAHTSPSPLSLLNLTQASTQSNASHMLAKENSQKSKA
jgi:hypothetical protein